jgi:hypothetical protein
MSEYLVLLKLNPGRIIDTLGAIRNLPATPSPGIWINAENSGQALEFVQKKVKDMNGVTEVYTLPTFPHANKVKSEDTEEAEAPEEQKRPIKK